MTGDLHAADQSESCLRRRVRVARHSGGIAPGRRGGFANSLVPSIAWASFLGGDPVCNFVILGLRHDAPRHQFARLVIGTPRNHPVCFCCTHARQAQQLLSCSSVQIERLVAAPALANPCRHRLGIALHRRRCLRGFLLQILRVLLVSATRERSQQHHCTNVPISEEIHLINFFPLPWMIFQPRQVGHFCGKGDHPPMLRS